MEIKYPGEEEAEVKLYEHGCPSRQGTLPGEPGRVEPLSPASCANVQPDAAVPDVPAVYTAEYRLVKSLRNCRKTLQSGGI